MRKLMLPLLAIVGVSFAKVAVAQDQAAPKPEKKAKKKHGKKKKKEKKADEGAGAAQ